MKKFCVLMCLILCLSSFTGCIFLLPVTKNDDNSTSGEVDADTSTQIVLGSDKEIALKANHPKYLDGVQGINNVWAQY